MERKWENEEEMEREWGNEEEMEREWGNGERMRKWRGNGERKRKWRENEEMERELHSQDFLILCLFPPSLSISYIKNCQILSQNVKCGTFVANVTKNLTYALWEKKLCQKFAARKLRKLWGSDCSIVLNRGVAGTIWKYVEFRIIYSWELQQKFKNSCLISKSFKTKSKSKCVNASVSVIC